MDSEGEMEKRIFNKPMENKGESGREQFHGRRDRILAEDRGATFPRERGGGDPFAAEKPKTGLHESWEKSPQLAPCPTNTSSF